MTRLTSSVWRADVVARPPGPCPSVGGTTPASTRIVVDLPAPLRPSRAVASAGVRLAGRRLTRPPRRRTARADRARQRRVRTRSPEHDPSRPARFVADSARLPASARRRNADAMEPAELLAGRSALKATKEIRDGREGNARPRAGGSEPLTRARRSAWRRSSSCPTGGSSMQMYGVVGNFAEAEDLVQEAFVRAAAAAAAVPAGRQPGSLAAQDGDQPAPEALAQAAQLQSDPPALEVPPADLPGLEEHLAVIEALRQLPEAQREVLALHYLADLPVAGDRRAARGARGHGEVTPDARARGTGRPVVGGGRAMSDLELREFRCPCRGARSPLPDLAEPGGRGRAAAPAPASRSVVGASRLSSSRSSACARGAQRARRKPWTTPIRAAGRHPASQALEYPGPVMETLEAGTYELQPSSEDRLPARAASPSPRAGTPGRARTASTQGLLRTPTQPGTPGSWS